MTNTLNPGEVRTGQITTTDVIAGTLQSAALVFDERRGAQLLVPHVRHMDQFAQANAWFRSPDGAPKRLLFADDRGFVTLVGLTFMGSSGSRLRTGRLGADTVIFGRPTRLKDEYKIRNLRSTIDGLDGFANFAPVKYDFPRPGEPAKIHLDRSETVTWRSRGFTYAIQATATESGIEGQRFEVTSGAMISTSSSRGATPREHLRAHWAIRDLLLFSHGRPLAWRSHHIVDNAFPVFTLDGQSHGPDVVDTHFSGTVGEYTKPAPSSTSLAFPSLSLAMLGPSGLKRWTDKYSDDRFRRAVQPVAEVLNGAASFLEPKLMMVASALDYFGYFRYGDSSRRPMHESILKCLDDEEIDWPSIGTRMGIASAITQVNNDLKHPDRETRPDPDILAGVTALALVVARAQVFGILGVDASWRREFLSSIDGQHPARIFTAYNLHIEDNGQIKRTAE